MTWTATEYGLHRFAMHDMRGRGRPSVEHFKHHADVTTFGAVSNKIAAAAATTLVVYPVVAAAHEPPMVGCVHHRVHRDVLRIRDCAPSRAHAPAARPLRKVGPPQPPQPSLRRADAQLRCHQPDVGPALGHVRGTGHRDRSPPYGSGLAASTKPARSEPRSPTTTSPRGGAARIRVRWRVTVSTCSPTSPPTPDGRP